MRDGAPQTIYRKDYQVPDFLVDDVHLSFDIHPGQTRVKSRLQLRRQGAADAALKLDGIGLELESLAIDGEPLTDDAFQVVDEQLIVFKVPDTFELSVEVVIQPEANTSLEGLYKSRTMYCTQCEAEGFRKITYFPDRPDVLAVYTVEVIADQQQSPVLLSNGNLLETKTLADGRHRAVWHDPYPKPSYLFALVAGDLALVEDSYTTVSGREVALRIWVEEKDRHYCDHAMASLKHSMRWDEEVYGLEYDLDLFNIVAVDDFNMGAMENKSLNIFNTSCVLAAPDITTDMGYQRVEAIVAHEYFHNYSGNRVTCRDWFQLSLKEGFTVFRDAEFSADMNSRGVKRVEDVTFLRTHQFAEDAGPMAHPVRPDSFIEISNFYTLTVYEKGAEVVRMLHTLLGADAFHQGATLYFSRHDGQAVTCDDFVTAMEDASGRDLTQFRRWYEQAGTPRITVSGKYDSEQQRYSLSIHQENPDSAGQTNKPPLLIPIAVGLIVDGQPLPLSEDNSTQVLELTEREQTFTFDNVPAEPVPSLLRGFSAPVRVMNEPGETELLTLMRGDDDDFVRWDSAQTLLAQLIESEAASIDEDLLDACRAVLNSPDMDAAMKAHTLRLPSEDYLADRAALKGLVDVHRIHHARNRVKAMLAAALAPEWKAAFDDNVVNGPYQPKGAQIGQRALRHLALDYLCSGDTEAVSLASKLYFDADNLTDRLSGARLVVNLGTQAERETLLAHFHDQWSSQSLVMNQWLSLQATRPAEDCVEAVRALREHPVFDWRNPNKLRSLIGAFAAGNTIAFHRADGAGYALLAETVAHIQADNPQIAARMLSPLTRWRRYAQGQKLMRNELERIANLDNLSRDVFEVVSRSLAEV
jgi:aminopeptidase N